MFGFSRRDARTELIGRLHAAIVAASRAPALYGDGGMPDTVEGRFEALTLHAILVLRRLRALPSPADEVAQDLVDSVFAHLEIALREMGVGDFGVPKRMKKLAHAFYDRVTTYEACLAAADASGLGREIADRLGSGLPAAAATAGYCLEADRVLSACDLDRILAGPPFPDPTFAASDATA